MIDDSSCRLYQLRCLGLVDLPQNSLVDPTHVLNGSSRTRFTFDSFSLLLLLYLGSLSATLCAVWILYLTDRGCPFHRCCGDAACLLVLCRGNASAMGSTRAPSVSR